MSSMYNYVCVMQKCWTAAELILNWFHRELELGGLVKSCVCVCVCDWGGGGNILIINNRICRWKPWDTLHNGAAGFWNPRWFPYAHPERFPTLFSSLRHTFVKV